MKRRSFLQAMAALVSGPAIIDIPLLETTVPPPRIMDFAQTGFLDSKNLDKLYLVNHASRFAFTHGVEPGTWIQIKAGQRDKFIVVGKELVLKPLGYKPVAVTYAKEIETRLYDVESAEFKEVVSHTVSHMYSTNLYGAEIFYGRADGKVFTMDACSKTLRHFITQLHATVGNFGPDTPECCLSVVRHESSRVGHWFGPKIHGVETEDLGELVGNMPQYDSVLKGFKE